MWMGLTKCRKPQRLTFSHRNQVQLTDFYFTVTGFEFVSTRSCESNSIYVEKIEPSGFCTKWILVAVNEWKCLSKGSEAEEVPAREIICHPEWQHHEHEEMPHSCSILNTCMKSVTHIYLIETESCMSWNPSSSLQYNLIWLVLLYILLLTATSLNDECLISIWKKNRIFCFECTDIFKDSPKWSLVAKTMNTVKPFIILVAIPAIF